MNAKTTPTIVATAALLLGGLAAASLPSAAAPASGAPESARPQVQQPPGAADLAELERTLAAAQDAPLDSAEHARAILAVRAAGASGDRSTIPALWRLAERLSEGQAQLVALEALDALWRLGAPAQEFEARLDRVLLQPNLARFSGLVLARSLQPEHVARIEAMARRAEDANLPQRSLFPALVMRARVAATVAGSYERAPSLEARVDAVAPFSLGSFSPFLTECAGLESPLTTADPVTFVARAKLYELSAAEPVATVTALIESEMGGRLTPELMPDDAARESTLDAFRDHAAQHLAPAAKAVYENLRPQAFDHASHR